MRSWTVVYLLRARMQPLRNLLAAVDCKACRKRCEAEQFNFIVLVHCDEIQLSHQMTTARLQYFSNISDS
jgi:hypothetical protein